MSKGSFRDLFTMGEDRHLHRTILAYVNQVFQQISGINLITYYAATIYQNQIGLSGLTSRALAAANGTGMLVNRSAIVCRSWKTDTLRCQSTFWLPGLLFLPLKDSAGALCKQRCFFKHSLTDRDSSMIFGSCGMVFSMVILAIMVRGSQIFPPTILSSIYRTILAAKGLES